MSHLCNEERSECDQPTQQYKRAIQGKVFMSSMQTGRMGRGLRAPSGFVSSTAMSRSNRNTKTGAQRPGCTQLTCSVESKRSQLFVIFETGKLHVSKWCHRSNLNILPRCADTSSTPLWLYQETRRQREITHSGNLFFLVSFGKKSTQSP